MNNQTDTTNKQSSNTVNSQPLAKVSCEMTTNTNFTTSNSNIGQESKGTPMSAKQKIACVPHLGDYDFIVHILIERCLNYQTVACPITTKKTVEMGSRNSPDTVCTPFKITLGNLMEGIGKGANVIVMPAFGCRLGFYDILQKQILAEIGHDIEILPLFDYTANAARLYKSLSEANPSLTQEQFDEVLGTVVKIVSNMDYLADYMRRNMAFEIIKGEFERQYKAFMIEAKTAKNACDAESIGEKYKEIFRSIKIDKPEKPIKIGIIGDLYTVIEPHGNCYMEKWFTDNKVEVVRPIDMTYLATTLFDPNNQIEKGGGYVNYNLGGNATNSIALAYEMAKEGYDGIVHVKAATCSPEITAMTILQNISKDYNIPIVYFTFDTETSEAGLYTRLEAFVDMLTMRKERLTK